MKGRERQKYTEHERDQMKFRISAAFERCCTSDALTCSIARCNFNESCAKAEHPESLLNVLNKYKLKSLLKNIVKRENLANGRVHPFFLGNTVIEQAETLLGQPLEDHPLFKDNKLAIKHAKMCPTLHQLIRLFNKQKLI